MSGYQLEDFGRHCKGCIDRSVGIEWQRCGLTKGVFTKVFTDLCHCDSRQNCQVSFVVCLFVAFEPESKISLILFVCLQMATALIMAMSHGSVAIVHATSLSG